MLNCYAFSIIFIGHHAAYFTRPKMVRIVRIRLRAIHSKTWQKCWLHHKDVSAKFCDATVTLVSHVSRGVEDRGVWPRPPRWQAVDPNGRGQSLLLGSPSAHGGDSLISEEVVSSVKTALHSSVNFGSYCSRATEVCYQSYLKLKVSSFTQRPMVSNSQFDREWLAF